MPRLMEKLWPLSSTAQICLFQEIGQPLGVESCTPLPQKPGLAAGADPGLWLGGWWWRRSEELVGKRVAEGRKGCGQLWTQKPTGQKLVKPTWDPWWCWFLQGGNLLASSAEQVPGNHGHSCCVADIGNSYVSSLFLACLYTSQLCQFLDGVKPKWVLNVVSWKAREAGRSPCSLFRREGHSF